jgi:FAD-dependent oxidoreductase domain-containing protein 1
MTIMAGKAFDVVVVGGGIMGSATAYELVKQDPTLRVAIVERDPTYTKASSALSMTNARIQFNLKQNVQISLYAFDVLERFEEEMAVGDLKPHIMYRREGNLFLVDQAGKKDALASLSMQKGLGCDVEWWSRDEIRRHFPLYDVDSYEGGTYGAKDGHFDAYAAVMGYKAKSKSLGAVYVDEEAKAILTEGARVTGVKVGSGETIEAPCVVSCTGAWAAEIAKSVGIQIPVVPIKRQVFAVDPAVKPEGPLPLTILPSGLYFRTEAGGLLLIGKSLESDPIGYDFSWDQNRFFDELWPELATFAPAFERLKLVRGWAGLYEVNTLDYNGIIGPWPGLKGFYVANGFSGHGLQQGPGVGRHMAELILGKPLSLDLSIFTPERIIENRPIGGCGMV